MLKMLAATAAIALFAGSAGAAITVTSGSPAGETLVETFDTPISTGFSFTPTQSGTATSTYTTGTYTGSISNIAMAPAGDTTTYFAVLGGSNASGTLTSTEDLSSISVEIGSLDAYNSISFYSSTGALIETLTGSEIGSATSTGYYTFTDTTGYFDKVVFSSSSNSMEIDNIAVAAAPEPSTWVMMFAGVAMIGGMLRSRRRGLAIAA